MFLKYFEIQNIFVTICDLVISKAASVHVSRGRLVSWAGRAHNVLKCLPVFPPCPNNNLFNIHAIGNLDGDASAMTARHQRCIN